MLPKKRTALYSAPDQVGLSVLKAYLQDHGINTYIMNSYLGGAAGEIPVFECWPRLMLVDEDQREYAKSLIKAFYASSENSTDWVCSECGETVDAEFSVCWNCGNVSKN